MFEIELISGTDMGEACEKLYLEVLKRKETGYIRFNSHTIVISNDCPDYGLSAKVKEQDELIKKLQTCLNCDGVGGCIPEEIPIDCDLGIAEVCKHPMMIEPKTHPKEPGIIGIQDLSEEERQEAYKEIREDFLTTYPEGPGNPPCDKCGKPYADYSISGDGSLWWFHNMCRLPNEPLEKEWDGVLTLEPKSSRRFPENTKGAECPKCESKRLGKFWLPHGCMGKCMDCGWMDDKVKFMSKEPDKDIFKENVEELEREKTLKEVIKDTCLEEDALRGQDRCPFVVEVEDKVKELQGKINLAESKNAGYAIVVEPPAPKEPEKKSMLDILIERGCNICKGTGRFMGYPCSGHGEPWCDITKESDKDKEKGPEVSIGGGILESKGYECPNCNKTHMEHPDDCPRLEEPKDGEFANREMHQSMNINEEGEDDG